MVFVGDEINLGLLILFITLLRMFIGLELVGTFSAWFETDLCLIGVFLVEAFRVLSGLHGVSLLDKFLKTEFLHSQVPPPWINNFLVLYSVSTTVLLPISVFARNAEPFALGLKLYSALSNFVISSYVCCVKKVIVQESNFLDGTRL